MNCFILEDRFETEVLFENLHHVINLPEVSLNTNEAGIT